MAPSVAREGTMRCKLAPPLHWAAVRSIFWVGGKSIMEIPDYLSLTYLDGGRNGAHTDTHIVDIHQQAFNHCLLLLKVTETAVILTPYGTISHLGVFSILRKIIP